MPVLLVFLAIAATFRVTWLINNDTIARPLRVWARKHDESRHGPLEDDEVPPLSYFVQCPWCVSMYVSVLVATVTVLWGDNRVVLIGLLALTASALTGIVASLLNRVLDG